jgi:hypothetical protein
VWDNRATKRNPRAPDFKCRDRSCDGVIWPGQHAAGPPTGAPESGAAPRGGSVMRVGPRERNLAREVADHVAHAAAAPSAPADARERYLAITAYVLARVRPLYAEAQVACDGQSVAAIAATLFIAGERAGRP